MGFGGRTPFGGRGFGAGIPGFGKTGRVPRGGYGLIGFSTLPVLVSWPPRGETVLGVRGGWPKCGPPTAGRGKEGFPRPIPDGIVGFKLFG